MATFYLFDDFWLYLGDGNHADLNSTGPIDLNSDSFACALTLTAPVHSTAQFTDDITQITASNGYTTVTTGAGQAAGSPAWAETGAGTGIYQFTTSDVVFTASGGTMPDFRYPVLVDQGVNDVGSNPLLVGFLDYGSTVSLTDTNTFTVNVGANGWFQLTNPSAAT